MTADTHTSHVEQYLFRDDGTFPNNGSLPLLIYRQVLPVSGGEGAIRFEKVLRQHRWSNSWRNGVFSYHHYHSITHEVLGIYQGEAQLQFGGDQGVSTVIKAGDAVVIPAGVAHKNLGSSSDFACVGAYPEGKDYDMNYGKEGERPRADQHIAALPVPATDPFFGSSGPLLQLWKK